MNEDASRGHDKDSSHESSCEIGHHTLKRDTNSDVRRLLAWSTSSNKTLLEQQLVKLAVGQWWISQVVVLFIHVCCPPLYAETYLACALVLVCFVIVLLAFCGADNIARVDTRANRRWLFPSPSSNSKPNRSPSPSLSSCEFSRSLSSSWHHELPNHKL